MEKDKSRINQLLASSTVTNEALKAALKKHEETQAAILEKNLLAQFNIIVEILNESVSKLRNVRQMEKIARKRVLTVDAAFETFKQDGDFEKFQKTVEKVGILV